MSLKPALVVVEKTSGTIGKRVQKLLLGQLFSNLSEILKEKNMVTFQREGGGPLAPTGLMPNAQLTTHV